MYNNIFYMYKKKNIYRNKNENHTDKEIIYYIKK